jgi:hypothetical protein
VQKITLKPEFALYLYMEKQLYIINKTTYDLRILHFDATGGRIKLYKKYCELLGQEYSRFLVYFMLLKNYDNLGSAMGSTLIGELATTSHTAFSQGSFLFHYKRAYESIYNKELHFRLFVAFNSCLFRCIQQTKCT